MSRTNCTGTDAAPVTAQRKELKSASGRPGSANSD